MFRFSAEEPVIRSFCSYFAVACTTCYLAAVAHAPVQAQAPARIISFTLSDDSLARIGDGANEAASDSEPYAKSKLSAKDNYQLPQLADVRDPIPLNPLSGLSQNDPSGLLNDNAVPPDVAVDAGTRYSDLAGVCYPTRSTGWEPPNFFHRPLYFEDAALERWGIERPHQNFASAARFFGTIPLLPYKMGASRPHSKHYVLPRSGVQNCGRRELQDFTFSHRGAFWQGLVTAALVIP